MNGIDLLPLFLGASDPTAGHGPSFVADFALVLAVAGLTGVVARRFKQPTVLAYLLAGFVVGPYLPIPLFADATRVEALAEFGVILVMFAVGVEFSLAKLLRVLPVSGVTGLVQVGFLAWCGFAVGSALGWPRVEAIFLASALAISSTMVVTRVFAESPVPEDVRAHVLGILVIQDVLAIVIIAALTGIAAGGGLEPAALLLVLAKLSAVLVSLFGVGLLVVPPAVRWVSALNSDEALIVFVVGLCFSVGHLAEALGYSVALGAFVAGVLVAESGLSGRVEHLIEPLRDIFAAVFFVSIGMSFDPNVAITHLPTALLLTAAVIFGHLLSVTGSGVLSGSGLRKSLFSAISLGQIGEFAFIIASVGIGAGVVRKELQPILLMVAVITAFTTPLMIRLGPTIVRVVDRRLPPVVHRLIGLYEGWFGRVRHMTATASPSRMTRALRNVVIDAVAAVLVVAFTLSWFRELHDALKAATEWPPEIVTAVIGGLCMLALLPLLFGFARNTLIFSAAVADAVVEASLPGSTGYRLARRLARTTVHMLITLGVGLPAAAIIRPELPGPFGLPVVLAVASGFLIAVLRDARGLEPELRSGAERIARELARRSKAGPLTPARTVGATEPQGFEAPKPNASAGESLPRPFPGFEAMQLWSVSPEARAADATLADLDLRASTGVVVVTIQRGQEIIALPTGNETLRAGDVLGLWGSPAAMDQAYAILDRPRDGNPAPAE